MGRKLTPYRKKYLNLRVSEGRRRLKLKAIEYKGGACQKCGYNKCQAALQFHHLDPSKKDFQISGKYLTWDKIKPELDKTILICANCHLELHDEQTQVNNIFKHKEVVRMQFPCKYPEDVLTRQGCSDPTKGFVAKVPTTGVSHDPLVSSIDAMRKLIEDVYVFSYNENEVAIDSGLYEQLISLGATPVDYHSLPGRT